MCDDLAIATSNVNATWALLRKMFPVIERFSSLRVNRLKTQILYACGDMDGMVAQDFLRWIRKQHSQDFLADMCSLFLKGWECREE